VGALVAGEQAPNRWVSARIHARIISGARPWALVSRAPPATNCRWRHREQSAWHPRIESLVTGLTVVHRLIVQEQRRGTTSLLVEQTLELALMHPLAVFSSAGTRGDGERLARM